MRPESDVHDTAIEHLWTLVPKINKDGEPEYDVRGLPDEVLLALVKAIGDRINDR